MTSISGTANEVPRMEASAVRVERWPTEGPLFVLVVLAAVAIWALLAVSVFGLVYVGLIGLFLFLTHVVMVTHIRGSAVRLGTDQFPELHERVLELASQAGIDPVPEAYLMEAGGSLNAFATRFLRSRMIVLYSDLLEACGEDEQARDMVIGHELGHIKAGHLRFHWFLAPGLLLPFVGSSYSRACEHTCDRWGRALCGSTEGAVRGLAILAAGGHLAGRVNLRSFVHQTTQLDTGWMTVGKWLSRYPPLCDRVAALQPELGEGVTPSVRGPMRAVLLLASVVVIPALLFAGAFAVFSFGINALGRALPGISEAPLALEDDEGWSDEPAPVVEDVEAATAQVERDFERILALAEAHLATTGALPAAISEVEELWAEAFPDLELPRDPFDGLSYGYGLIDDDTVHLLSSGPDGESHTEDDITVERLVSPTAELAPVPQA